jgi:hypothetical protein
MGDRIGFALRRFLRDGWILIIVAAMMHAAADAARADPAVFLAAYRCDVVARLTMIHANHTSHRSDNRYLILDLQAGQRGFVQCLFDEGDAQILCEAESGYYPHNPAQPREFRVDPKGVAALARLGFSTDDSEGNYQRVISLSGPYDYATVADVMLTALYEVYGARMDSKLEWQAPLAPGKGLFARCAPVS